MNQRSNRRDFLKTSSLAGFGMLLSGSSLVHAGRAPSEKLNIGCVGTQNRASANIGGIRSQNIVAICDTDQNYLERRGRDFPKANKYNDYRKLVDQKDIDAIVVSTPDHMHAPATGAALRSGRHAYCEKPLSHTVHEARVIAGLAKKHKRATQLGTQIHAGSNYRRVVEIIQSGAIGDVIESHVWVGKSWSAGDRPAPAPTPAHIHFDLWLGPARERKYHPNLLPANWRKWWEFGGGTLGDMGCHHMDLSHWALKLRHPVAASTKGPPVHAEGCPSGLHVTLEYPARGKLPPVKLHWYDSGKHRHLFKKHNLPNWGDGTLFVGTKGVMLASYGGYKLLPEADFKGYRQPAKSIPDSIGHYNEWIQACKTGSPTTCNFDYSGALTEAVLLGNVAYRAGERIEWDGEKCEVTNSKKANSLVRKEYRKGWEV